jgi:predicted DNA-binding ribbon-helix-helix protein
MGEGSNRRHPPYSSIRKRSVAIAGNRTSVSLEDPFWRELRAIAFAERLDTSVLVAEIAVKCGNVGISSAIRQFVLSYCLRRALAAPSTGLRGETPDPTHEPD